MGNCSGFCMASNNPSTQGEQTYDGNAQVNKKVITADRVKQAYLEKDDMMLAEGAAGAAQYEEVYGQNNRSGRGTTSGGAQTIQPRKLGKNPQADGGYLQQQQDDGNYGNNGQGDNGDNDNGAPQRESLPPITLPSGAIYTGQWLNGMKDGYGQ